MGGTGTATDGTSWDAQEVKSWCLEQDDPAAAFRAVSGIPKTVGGPDEAQHWALLHHVRPGRAANAAAIRNARSRFDQTQDLADRDAARRHIFETHKLPSEVEESDAMKDIERKKMLAKLARGGRWYSISNQAGPVAEVRIYDEIGWFGITAEDFVNDLAAITAPEIVCAINCPGGDVFDGIAIYNALRAHPAKVTTRVDSLAASVASVIVQGGDRRVMLSASQMMIHEAWGITIGTAAEMREFADLLDRQTDVIAGIYAARTGGEVEHFRGLMAGEKWFTDAEAVAEGLADEVVDPGSKDAPAARLANRTLNDELAEAMDVVSRTIESAERVDALRAEQGKELSQVNRVSLDELRGRMERLNVLLEVEESPDYRDEIAREHARFAALTMEV